jgi:outer membrane protein assembly factor BamD (BamD/ComL family)
MDRVHWLGILSIMAFLLSGSGCATISADFESAGKIGSLEAYETFLKKHPKGEYSQKARKKIELARWETAKNQDNIEGYENFLAGLSLWKNYSGTFNNAAKSRIEELHYKDAQNIATVKAYSTFLDIYPQGKYTDKAVARLEEIRYRQVKMNDKIEHYEDFIKDFPKSRFNRSLLSRIEEKRFKNAVRSNSEKALRQFMQDFPKSKNLKDAEAKLSEIYFSRAANLNTDAAYIDFLLKSPSSDSAIRAISRLQNYTYNFITVSKVLPWNLIDSIIAAGSTVGKEAYPYGVKMSGFSRMPVFNSINKQYRVDGDYYFFKRGSILNFKDWTRFSGYVFKGQASITNSGLKFLPGSEIIQPKGK